MYFLNSWYNKNLVLLSHSRLLYRVGYNSQGRKELVDVKYEIEQVNDVL